MTDNDILTIHLSDTISDYTLATKYFMMNGNLLKGTYIKAIPLDLSGNKKILSGFLVSTGWCQNKTNLYSKFKITIAYVINNKRHLLTFMPIKYDVYYKSLNTESKFRKSLIQLLEHLDD